MICVNIRCNMNVNVIKHPGFKMLGDESAENNRGRATETQEDFHSDI